jgi:N-acetylmuramoyl-L-alanine amidase
MCSKVYAVALPVDPSAASNPLQSHLIEPESLTLARHLTFLMIASTSLATLAQETTPAPQSQPPAPIVRVPAKPAPAPADGTTPSPPPPHLMVSHPVAKPSTTQAPTTSKPAASTTSTPATPRLPAPTAPAAAPAPQTAGPFNRTLIVLDPAHGGGDTGSRINDQLVEKDITLALAFRLRSLLSARGFTVVMTRDNEDPSAAPGTALSLDDRAGIANHARPVACLSLHATASGSGVHLYTSELNPTPGEAVPAPWLTAQAAWVAQSRQLATQVGAAFGRSKIPLVASTGSVRPVDSFTCPAFVLELAPNGTDPTTLNDAGYQQRVAEAVAGALVLWKNQAQPPVQLTPLVPPPRPHVATSTTAPSEETP